MASVCPLSVFTVLSHGYAYSDQREGTDPRADDGTCVVGSHASSYGASCDGCSAVKWAHRGAAGIGTQLHLCRVPHRRLLWAGLAAAGLAAAQARVQGDGSCRRGSSSGSSRTGVDGISNVLASSAPVGQASVRCWSRQRHLLWTRVGDRAYTKSPHICLHEYSSSATVLGYAAAHL